MNTINNMTFDDILGLIVFYGIVFLIIFLVAKRKKQKRQEAIEAYKQTTYFKQTQNEYDKTMKDLGSYGEYLIYDELKPLENESCRLLFNLYIPRDNGKYSEIDCLVITTHGLYVIESKNYSGWIFGSNDQKYWMQTFKTGDKQKFYNPIWQNNAHLKQLSEHLDLDNTYFKSLIAFSNRCTFKAKPDNTDRLSIIHRKDVLDVLKEDIGKTNEILTLEQVSEIYNKLQPLTNASEEIKQSHINDVSNIKQF